MTRTIQSQGKKKATSRDSLPRTPTTEEDSLSVVLLTRTPAFGIKCLLEEIKTLLSRCWVCGLGWVLFVFLPPQVYSIDVCESNFLIKLSLFITEGTKCSGKLWCVYEIHPSTKHHSSVHLWVRLKARKTSYVRAFRPGLDTDEETTGVIQLQPSPNNLTWKIRIKTTKMQQKSLSPFLDVF